MREGAMNAQDEKEREKEKIFTIGLDWIQERAPCQFRFPGSLFSFKSIQCYLVSTIFCLISYLFLGASLFLPEIREKLALSKSRKVLNTF